MYSAFVLSMFESHITSMFRRSLGWALFALVLLAARDSAAEPWTRTYGGCIFSGSGTLVRAGSCPTQSGILDLSQQGITELPARCDDFQCGIHGTTYQRTGNGDSGKEEGSGWGQGGGKRRRRG